MNAVMKTLGRFQVLSDNILRCLVGGGKYRCCFRKSDADPHQEEVYRRQYRPWESNARGHEFNASLGYIADHVQNMNFS